MILLVGTKVLKVINMSGVMKHFRMGIFIVGFNERRISMNLLQNIVKHMSDNDLNDYYFEILKLENELAIEDNSILRQFAQIYLNGSSIIQMTAVSYQILLEMVKRSKKERYYK